MGLEEEMEEVETESQSAGSDIRIVLSHPMTAIVNFPEGTQENMNVIHAKKIFEYTFL